MFRAVIDHTKTYCCVSVGSFSILRADLGTALADLAHRLALCWLHPVSIGTQRLAIGHRWMGIGLSPVKSISLVIALIEDIPDGCRSDIREIDLKDPAEQLFGLPADRHLLNAQMAQITSDAEITQLSCASMDILLRGVHAAGVRPS